MLKDTIAKYEEVTNTEKFPHLNFNAYIFCVEIQGRIWQEKRQPPSISRQS